MCSTLPKKIPLTCQKDEGQQKEKKPSIMLSRGRWFRRDIYFHIVISLKICPMHMFLLWCMPFWQQQCIQPHYWRYQLMDPNEQFLQPAGTSFNPHRRHAYSQKENHYLSAVSNDFANLNIIILMERGRGLCSFLR